ncbi:hypothetical protein BH10ACI3_BH10ACI3_13310 [soil metagenome]
MPIERSKDKDFKPLSAGPKPTAQPVGDLPTLRPPRAGSEATASEPQNLVNLNYSYPSEPEPALPETGPVVEPVSEASVIAVELPQPQTQSEAKKQKQGVEDEKLLKKDRWLVRNGHGMTFFALYLFSIMVLFRPYEIVPGLGFLSATAFYFAIVTLALFLPSQLAIEGNLTMLSTEVKAILAMTAIALLTMPIARDPGLAWTKFNDPYIKAVVIFIVLVNVVRTRQRLINMIWLSLGIGVYLGFSAMDRYMKGEFNVESYRVAVDVGGMFGNPNEMAMHFVMMTPISFALGLASKGKTMKLVYFAITGLFVAANMVTFSRGGFLGLLGTMAVMAWKLGRKHRANVSIASIIIGGILIVAAPGNYGLRMLSIFIPGLDAVGSSDQRRELLIRSLVVTARNPWGIGIGNFPLVGLRNLQSHNAFTQVSAELGILGLVAYMVFMISPFRKLRAIERALFESGEHKWFYFLAIGLQASIIGYMVSSFFASVAYGWFIYYLIAYAVAFRRIYSLETGTTEDIKAPSLWEPRAAEAA